MSNNPTSTSGTITDQLKNPHDPALTPAQRQFYFKNHPFAYAESIKDGITAPEFGQILKVYESDGVFYYRAVTDKGFSAYYSDTLMQFLIHERKKGANIDMGPAGSNKTMGDYNLPDISRNHGPLGDSHNSIDPDGWTHTAGTKLGSSENPDVAVIFVNQLVSMAGTTPVHVTSAFRDNSNQAWAIVRKMRAGDDLIHTYGDTIGPALISASQGYTNGTKWTEIPDGSPLAAAVAGRIEAYYDANSSLQSSHTKGLAVDLRVVGLSTEQREALKSTVIAVLDEGGAPPTAMTHETTPEHLHIELGKWNPDTAKVNLGYVEADAGEEELHESDQEEVDRYGTSEQE